MSWNYRIGTRMHKYPDEVAKSVGRTEDRLFSVVEVYYDDNFKPNGYIDTKNPLSDWDEVSELKGTYDLIAGAFENPIIDLDNFPNEYAKQ